MDEPGVGWVVSRHADVRSVLADPRYVVPPAEPAGPVGSLRWLRASVVDRAGREPFDVMAGLARRVPVGVLCAGLGVGDEELDGAAPGRVASFLQQLGRTGPWRTGAVHLTFGHGRRPCPGGDAALALAGGVVEVVLARCQLADPHVTLEPPPNLRIPSRLEVARR